ncbi:MAG: hypothetical protein K2V38_08260 [Gemmataceae bacterium]|nr:hypothetical protein [Gemmataceae bacterium]
MTAREKIAAAVLALKLRGINGFTAAPPPWRVLWWLGWNVPPPHFLRFVPLALIFGIPFGMFLHVLFVAPAVFILLDNAPALFRFEMLLDFVAMPALGGTGLGVLMALQYRWSAWRMGLPSWELFDPPAALTGGSDEDDPTW